MTITKSKHVLFVTISAYGHIIPMLELAKKTSRFHRVTLAVSAADVDQLRTRELLADGDQVELYAIPDGLILNHAADVNNKQARMQWQKAAKQSFAELLVNLPMRVDRNVERPIQMPPVDVIVADLFFGVPVPVAVPYYLFNAASGAVLQFALSIDDSTETISGEENVSTFMRIQNTGMGIAEPNLPILVHEKNIFLPVKKTMPRATGIIINSVRELEMVTLRGLKNHPSIAGLSVFCVGPLFASETLTTNTHHFAVTERVLSWLSAKKGVVYVSFGSFAIPTDEQLTVIGEALLAMGRPFIWSLQEKYHKSLPLRLQMTEPFDENFLVLPWTPQKRILAHSSVAVFVSHCGWNSVMEGLAFGKPFVAWPLFADQLVNAQWITKEGAGVLIPETGTKGVRLVPAHEIINAIARVGGWNREESFSAVSAYREAAMAWSIKLDDAWSANGDSSEEFMEFITFLLQK